MSLVKRTIEAFPLGRTTQQLLVLLDADFDRERRTSIIAEFGYLAELGAVRRTRDSKWFPLRASVGSGDEFPRPAVPSNPHGGNVEALDAAPATFSSSPADAAPIPTGTEDRMSPAALLRYYRAALRSDPRGTIAQVADRHGTAWQMLSGEGEIVPSENSAAVILVKLDALPGSFREALVKREAEDQSLAVGWPFAVDLRRGLSTI